MKNNIDLSIIIPAYNEEDRISLSLDTIYEYFDEKSVKYEVILVDDGSRDETVRVSQKSDLARSGKLRVISNERNRGKGFSVKTGILSSIGEYVLFTDADLSTPISEFEKLYLEVGRGYDVVMASRSIEGSVLTVSQPWYRQTMGRIFNLFVKILFFKKYNDTQCGFKLFSGDVARAIAGKMTIDGFCFDVEMLYLAQKMGCRIKEIGVIWKNSPESKVTILNSSFSMFIDLFRIKKCHG